MSGGKIRVGLIGHGNVGAGVCSMLAKSDFASLTHIHSRTKPENFENSYPTIAWARTPEEIITNDNIDVVVELIGGITTAKDVAISALKNKKHFVTANKEMIAKFGNELNEIAKENEVALLFEAAVAGGIPVLRTIRNNYASFDKIYEIRAILNGTCNYILGQMQHRNISFEQALKEAQDHGFAEADPSFDIDGVDAAHKLAIISAMCFKSELDFPSVDISGIRNIELLDIKLGKHLGYSLKLVNVSYRNDSGKIIKSTFPALMNNSSSFAKIKDSENILQIYSELLGKFTLNARGAGRYPTACSVMSDIYDIYLNNREGKYPSDLLFLRKDIADHCHKIDQVESGHPVTSYKFYIRDKNSKLRSADLPKEIEVSSAKEVHDGDDNYKILITEKYKIEDMKKWLSDEQYKDLVIYPIV